MSRNHLNLLVIAAFLAVGGCSGSVKVEPVSFNHKDEVIREGDFIVLADRRVFAIMAFMNACGYDEEFKGMQMHPARSRVREILQEQAGAHPEHFKKWKQYYNKVNLRNFHYQVFALSLTADYPFRRIRPDSELGYPFIGWRLAEFPNVLNEFWETLEMENVWAEVKPIYLDDIGKYNFDKMEIQLKFVWDYLRMERSDQFVFISVPNLLEQYFQAIGAQYENYWYMVESPGAGSHSLNIHEYLHSIVNSMVRTRYNRHSEKLNKYYEAGKDLSLAKSYRHPVTYTFECLVRALDMRIQALLEDNPSITSRLEGRAEYLTNNGLTIVQPFYNLLDEYEQSDKNFEQFLPVMVDMLEEYGK
ncbi:MAG: hypothetical protein ACYS67_01000 [Planctomycetota bacterium]|jgi:hypothetical protein